MHKMKNILKKGEVTTAMLIGIIILIVGFVIVLWFLIQLNLGGEVDDQVCHESVIFRGTLPSIAGIREFVPLKCKTEKICIGKECDEFTNSQKVKEVKISDEEQIAKLISQEVYSCWNMMGQGKVEIFHEGVAKHFALGNIDSSCVICSRIAFDEKVLEDKKINLERINLRRYMETHKAPETDVSYIEAMLGKAPRDLALATNQFSRDKVIVENPDGTFGVVEEMELNEGTEGFNNEANNELAIVFMQVGAPTAQEVLKNDLAVLGIGAAASAIYRPVATVKRIFSPVSTIKKLGRATM